MTNTTRSIVKMVTGLRLRMLAAWLAAGAFVCFSVVAAADVHAQSSENGTAEQHNENVQQHNEHAQQQNEHAQHPAKDPPRADPKVESHHTRQANPDLMSQKREELSKKLEERREELREEKRAHPTRPEQPKAQHPRQNGKRVETNEAK